VRRGCLGGESQRQDRQGDRRQTPVVFVLHVHTRTIPLFVRATILAGRNWPRYSQAYLKRSAQISIAALLQEEFFACVTL
jgi:hypothetical protein